MPHAKKLSFLGSLLAAAGFGWFIYLLLPAGVIAMNDDFGYLRSVVETLQKGRPWIDEWLAPWSAAPSMLAALLYHVTGSFRLAIQLTLALAGALAFYGTERLFRARSFAFAESIFCAFLLLSFPTVLWKEIEFTGVSLYVAFLLLALGAAEQKRWRWFLLWWTLGIATRQSAVAWAAMPMLELGRAVIQRRQRFDRETLTLGFVGVAGTGVFLLLTCGMNKTHSQRVLTDHTFDRIAWDAVVRGWITGAAVFLGAAGLGAFLLGWRAKAALRRPDWRAAVIALTLGLALVWIALRGWVLMEHPFFSHSAGHLFGGMILACILAGWLAVEKITLRGEHLLYAAASLCLVSLRPTQWDYYFIDIAAFGLFGVAVHASTEPIAAHASLSKGFRAVGALLIVFHLMIVGEAKVLLDRRYALCSLTEEALRAKRLDYRELSFAPFGLKGWYLFPWFITHEGRTDQNIAGFENYLWPEAVKIEYAYPGWRHFSSSWPGEAAQKSPELIAAGRYRLAWLFWADYALRRSGENRPHSAAMTLSPEYTPPPSFPTSDEEWKVLIAAPPVSP